MDEFGSGKFIELSEAIEGFGMSSPIHVEKGRVIPFGLLCCVPTKIFIAHSLS
jgi:hypothetical protein